jgi:hypothetical protein
LTQENILVVMINGRRVWMEFCKAMHDELDIVEQEEIVVSDGQVNTMMYTGLFLGRVLVVAWSANLQSSGSSQVTPSLRAELRRRVRAIATRT